MALLDKKSPYMLKLLSRWVAEYHYLIRFLDSGAVSPSLSHFIIFGGSSLLCEALVYFALVAFM